MLLQGIATVEIRRAAYDLPVYTILNASGYTFNKGGFGARIGPASRFTASILSSFASFTLYPTGYSETVLNPNTATGTSSAWGSVEKFDVSNFGYGIYAPHDLYANRNDLSIGTHAPASNNYSVPPGDPLVLYPEVNLQSAIWDYQPGPKSNGQTFPAYLWSGSSLFHQQEMQMMFWPGYGTWVFLSAFLCNPSVSSFVTETQDAQFFSSKVGSQVVCNMVQIRDSGTHGPSQHWTFIPQAYAPDAAPTPFIKTITFNNTAMDTAVSQTGEVRVSNHANGFVFRLHTNGAGPTGAEYEFAVTDENCSRYWLLKFVAGDSSTITAFGRGTPSIKIDGQGNIWFANGHAGDREKVFLAAVEFMNAWPIVKVANLPPITIPCFNPCLPSDLSQGIFKER